MIVASADVLALENTHTHYLSAVPVISLPALLASASCVPALLSAFVWSVLQPQTRWQIHAPLSLQVC